MNASTLIQRVRDLMDGLAREPGLPPLSDGEKIERMSVTLTRISEEIDEYDAERPVQAKSSTKAAR